MALYQGLNKGTEKEAPAAVRAARPGAGAAGGTRTLKVSVQTGSAEQGTFWERMFGTGVGAAKPVSKPKAGAEGTRRAAGSPTKTENAAKTGSVRKGSERARAVAVEERGTWNTARMEAVGAGEGPLPRGRRGVGRALLIVGGLAWAAMALRPWQRMGTLRADFGALVKASAAHEAHASRELKDAKDSIPAEDVQAEREAEAQREQEARAKAEDLAKLNTLPFQPGVGKPLALWQDSAGRWWHVDSTGALAPSAAPSATENLGLPEIRGVSVHPEEYRGGRREILGLPPGRIGELLPLDSSVAGEISVLEVEDPTQPVLVTHEGIRCLMGSGDWAETQRRLAQVLADLAARRRRAVQIDLRFEQSAVVRPAGR